MAYKIQNINNYTIVTQSGNEVFECPTHDVRFLRIGDTHIRLYSDSNWGIKTELQPVKNDNWIDSADSPIADIYNWIMTNTGN